MISRLVFFLVAAFWLAMNALLWRAEYGSRSSGLSVPADLVWRKILTAPDASSLTVYRDGKKSGFCQFATSVEQALSALEENTVPPEGMVQQAGYQIRFDGNVSLGEFVNRVTFSGRVQFRSNRDWRELHLKLSARGDVVELRSLAANRTVQLKITSEGAVIEREFTFAELQNPNQLLRAIAGYPGDAWPGELELIPWPQAPGAPAADLRWEARHDRLMIGSGPVSAYRLETRILEHPVVIYASMLGEILRVELPGGITAVLDQIGGPAGGRHD
jgi:hypothetical protein